MLLTSGERMSAALLCMALAELGVDAASFTGSQAGIITDTTHMNAKIVEVKADRLRDALDEGRVPVVAGFQGVSPDRDVTTLGRGGSDTTAVALAAALGADACEIYTDVSGVFSADPRIVPEARRLARVSFEEMLDIAASGGRVLSLRSVEFARNHHVPLHVRSSFTWEPGTWVVEEDPSMEQAVVTAVTHDTSEAKVTVTGVPDKPGIAAQLFRALADRAVNVDTIVQNTSLHGTTDISFTVPKTDLAIESRAWPGASCPRSAPARSLPTTASPRCRSSGRACAATPGCRPPCSRSSPRRGINIEMISTSSIRISCVVRADRVEEAVRLLHAAFELSEP